MSPVLPSDISGTEEAPWAGSLTCCPAAPRRVPSKSKAVAAKDREHADVLLELANQPELPRILGRVSQSEERGSSTVCLPSLRGRA